MCFGNIICSKGKKKTNQKHYYDQHIDLILTPFENVLQLGRIRGLKAFTIIKAQPILKQPTNLSSLIKAITRIC